MKQFLVQINTTAPANWQSLVADSYRDAAITALHLMSGEELEALGEKCTVYVGSPKDTHDNGAPRMVHALDIVFTRNSHASEV